MNMLNSSFSNGPKKVMLINGTCGGCKSFEIESAESNFAEVQCSNKESPHHGTKPGILAINGCTNYEPKEKAPEGFKLI